VQDNSACIKASSEEIYSKSMMCDFLLMDNSKIFPRIEVENSHFCPLYSD